MASPYMMAEAAAGSGEDDQEVAADGLTQRQRFLQHKAKVEREKSGQLLEQNIGHLDPGVQEDARLDFQAGLIGTDLALTQKGQFEVNLANYPVEEDKEDLRDYFGRGFVDRDLQLTRRGELYTSDLETVLDRASRDPSRSEWIEWVEMGAWDEHRERTGEDPFLKQVGGAVKSLVTEVVPEAVAYGSTGVMASTPFIKAADWVGSLGIPEGVPFLGAFTKMHEARKDAKLSVTELQRATRKELAAGAGAAARAGMENQVVLDKGRQLLQAKAQAGVTGAIAGLFDGGLGDADTAVLMALYDFENSKRILREASADEAAGALLSLAALGASEAERMEKAEFGIQTSQAARAGRSPEELAAIDKEAASYGMLGLDPSFPLTPAASLTAKGARTAGLHLGKPLFGRTTLKATDDAAKHLAALTARRAAMAKAAAREGAAPVVPGAGAGTAATPRPGLKTTGKRAARRTARQEIFARNLQRLDDEIYTAKRNFERHTARLGGVGALVKDGVRQASKDLYDRFKQTRPGSWATGVAIPAADDFLANLGRRFNLSSTTGSLWTGLSAFGLFSPMGPAAVLTLPALVSRQYRILRGATQMINAAGAEFFRRRVTMPYWQRVSERVAENPWASGAASAIDVFARPLTAATKATGNVGSAIARSTASEIPFSAMATGGEEGWLVETTAEAIAFSGPGQLQGLIHGLGGAPARLKKHEFDLLAQNDVAELRRNLSLGQREVFDLLDPVVKRQVGVYSALFPDVNFQFIPGSGGGAYREKTKTLIIDPESKNPLDVMLAHEIGHSLAARGMKEKIYTELVGPGGLLRDKDGNLTKEAKDFKREYENRLNRGRPPKEPRLELSDQRLAEEWFAEAVAPGLQKSQKLQKLVRRNKLITGLAEAVLPRVPFGKAMLLRRGVLLDKNGNLAKGQGAMVSANLSPALARLADAYLRNNAGSRFVPKGKRVPGWSPMFAGEEVGGRTIEDLHRKAIYTREDMDRMEERNMIDYERNPDGSVKRDRFGRAKGLEPSVLAAQETTIGNIIRKVAEKYGVVPLTQKRGGDRFDKLTREQWDEILEEIRKTRLYNDHQIAAMRSAFRGMADNDGKAHRFQYHKALDTNEKTGKKSYKPKPQEDRVGSIYSIEVTKANNVIVKVIDMDALEERAIKASQSKDAPAMYRDNSADIMRDLMVLAENHNKPDMDNVDVFGEERARFLNGVLGQLSKEHAFNNPTVKGGRPPIRSFRLDRANFVYNTNEDGLTFNHHQWVQGLMPEPADATTQQSDAARQDTINRLPEGDPSTGAEEGGLPAGERRGMGGDQGWVPEPDSPYPPATRPALIGLPQRIDLGDGRTVIFGPFQPARQAAEDYMAGAGLEYVPPTTYAKVDRERATRIADEYERMPHAPDDPEVREAYRAMIDETLAQYEAIKATGLVVEPMPRGTEPYGNPRNAILDVVENNHMWFFPTNEGFGGDAVSDVDVAENPLLEETGEVINGYRMTANDVFRVVHDYFGHVKEGNGFRAGGEENAWRAHSAMYSPKARRAMTSETRGQNSWVNYGPHGEFNRTASGADTEYAAQKTGLLPEWVTEEGAGDDIRRMPEGEGYPRDRRTLLAEERRNRGDGKEELTLKDLKRDLVALVTPSGVELARYQLVSNVGWVELDDIRRMPEQLDADYKQAIEKGTDAEARAVVTAAAQRAGFLPAIVYRGDIEPFNVFDKRRRGEFTKAPAAKLAFYFSDDFSVGALYRDRSVEHYNDLEKKAEIRVLKAEEDRLIRALAKFPETVELARRMNAGTGEKGIKMALGLDDELVSIWQESLSGEAAKINDRRLALQEEIVSLQLGPNPNATKREGVVRRFYVKMQNPKRIDQSKRDRAEDITQALKEGHDGVIFENDPGHNDSDVYAVFEPEQIKNAALITYDDQGNLIPLSERFNPESDDIRRMPEQLDADHRAAEQAGDFEAGQALVDQAAKRAGSGPKVYRGDAEAFNVFDKARRGESTEAEAAYEGFFFTSAPAAATMFRDLAVGKHQKPGHPKSKDPARKGGAVRSFYLQTKNPKIIDQGKRKKLPMVSLHVSHLFRRKDDIVQAREEGHDGVIFKNDYDLTEADNYVVFEPEQIKSADPFTYDEQGNLIPLSERFNPESDDIRRMPEDPTALPIVEARNEDGSVKKKDNKVVYETVDYDLLHAPALEQEAPPPQDTTKPDYDSLHYHVTKKDRERIDELIDSGAVDAAAADLEADAMQAMDIPEIASGIGWYSRMRKKLRIALAGDHELFADLLGATSANTDVEQNFIYAFDAYRQFKAGKFDKMLKRFQEAVDLADSGKLKETMIARRIIGKRQAKRMDQQALLKKWIKRYNLEPRRADGAKYGMNSAHVFRALSGQFTQVRGPRAKDKLSPKTPQFSMNLFGSSLSATIDVWAARYLRRRLYSGQVKQWRIQPKSETGVSNGDFLLGQEIFRRAADKLGLSPDDLQALMWFMEKDVWDQAGWTKGAGAIKTSFDQAADAFFPPKQKMSASQLAQANRRGLSSLNFIRKHRAVENAATRLEALAGQTGRKVTTAKRNLRNARKELTKARKRAGVAEFLERNPELN